MGLFDKITGGKVTQLDPKSALPLAAMTMIGIDGSIEDEEVATLRRIIRGDSRAFDQAFKVYKDKSIDESVQMVANSLDQKQKIATLANLLDITMADGVLAGVEEKLMMSYVNAFQVPEDLIKDIVDVIAMKNDFSIFG
jgi:uncharacterized tellurite resistance protein B-like protein